MQNKATIDSIYYNYSVKYIEDMFTDNTKDTIENMKTAKASDIMEPMSPYQYLISNSNILI